MSYCPTCGMYMLYHEHHTCPPQWEAQDPETRADDDWTVVHAHDGEGAAVKYAERADDCSGEGPHERTVLVRELGSSEAKQFAITWECSVDYYAHEVTT